MSFRSVHLVATIGILLVGACLSVPNAEAQATFSGAVLRGEIRDPTLAPVPGARVTITNIATQVSDRTTTDAAGRYTFNTLQPATYTLRVEAAGFRAMTQRGVVLRVGQQSDLDFTLQLGSVETTIEVKAAAPLLMTGSAVLGQVVDNRAVMDLPLLDRNVINLAYTIPGVTEIVNSYPYGTNAVNFVSNGQQNSTVEIRVDGGEWTAPSAGAGDMVRIYNTPTPDAVQEFKIQNNSYSSEYGNNGGTVMNIVLKSGTNQMHGSGYWYFRRPSLDANSFFSNEASLHKSPYQRDNWGGSLGGPIFKQRTFFFVDADVVRYIAPATLVATVPTMLQRQGDFSQSFNADGTLQTVYNPFQVSQVGGVWMRQPFQGNVVPASMQNPMALKWLQFYPAPTSAGNPLTHVNNLTLSTTADAPTHQYDVKIDHNVSDKSRLMARFSEGFQGGGRPRFFHNAADDTFLQDFETKNGVLEYLRTLSPTMTWTSRFAINYFNGSRLSPAFDPTSIGLPPQFASIGTPIFPYLSLGGYRPLGNQGGENYYDRSVLPHWSSQVIKIVGGHSLTFGFEERVYEQSYWQPVHCSGEFSFSQGPTEQMPFVPNPKQGNAVASLMLGWLDSGDLPNPSPSDFKSSEHAVYFQDDWKATSRLTLNLGLRWEMSFPYSERHNRLAFANYGEDSGVNVPGIGEIYGVNDVATSNHHRAPADINNVGPRLGVAYRVTSNTVMRAGGGVYYGLSAAQNNQINPAIFNATTNITASLDGGLTQYASLSNLLPNGLVTPQGGTYGKLAGWGFANADRYDNHFQNPDVYMWSASIQRQLPSNMLVEVAYSANRTTHLPFGDGWSYYQGNYIPAPLRQKYGDAGLAEQVPNPFYSFFQGPSAVINQPTSIYNRPTTARINLLRLYPQFPGNFAGFNAPLAWSNYNSLQVRFEKKYSHGLDVRANYTFSKMMDLSEGFSTWLVGGWGGFVQDQSNRNGERSLAAADTPHRLVFDVIYELPIGRGRAVGRGWSRALDAAAGGWQVNGIVTYQSGLPLALGMAGADIADGVQRPNLVGNPWGATVHDTVAGKAIRFNNAAFAVPPSQVDGTCPRYEGQVRGDSVHNLDLSLFKAVRLKENMKMEVRAEFFNFTNTPRFGDPATSYRDPAFGTINSQVNLPRTSQIGVRFVW